MTNLVEDRVWFVNQQWRACLASQWTGQGMHASVDQKKTYIQYSELPRFDGKDRE